MRLDTNALDDWSRFGRMPGDTWCSWPWRITTERCRVLGGAELGSPEFDRRVGTWITAWVAHLRSKGITPDRLGLLIHDEPHEGSDIGPLLAWARAIHAAEPDVLIWEDPTYQHPAGRAAGVVRGVQRALPQPSHVAGRRRAVRPVLSPTAGRGRTLQFYSCSGPARLLDPYAYYRLQAWQCWQEGATGSFFWAFGDNGGASSWNEYFAAAGPYTPLFLDERTVTAGKHMEAIRESVEDYEYFVMLRDAVARARAAGRTDPAVTAAQTLLADGARTVLSAEGVNQLPWENPKDRTLADRMRVKVLQALTDLQ